MTLAELIKSDWEKGFPASTTLKKAWEMNYDVRLGDIFRVRSALKQANGGA